MAVSCSGQTRLVSYLILKGRARLTYCSMFDDHHHIAFLLLCTATYPTEQPTQSSKAHAEYSRRTPGCEQHTPRPFWLECLVNELHVGRRESICSHPCPEAESWGWIGRFDVGFWSAKLWRGRSQGIYGNRLSLRGLLMWMGLVRCDSEDRDWSRGIVAMLVSRIEGLSWCKWHC